MSLQIFISDDGKHNPLSATAREWCHISDANVFIQIASNTILYLYTYNNIIKLTYYANQCMLLFLSYRTFYLSACLSLSLYVGGAMADCTKNRVSATCIHLLFTPFLSSVRAQRQ